MISYKKLDKPDYEWLQVTTGDYEPDYEWLQATTRDCERLRARLRVTTSDYKWLRSQTEKIIYFIEINSSC